MPEGERDGRKLVGAIVGGGVVGLNDGTLDGEVLRMAAGCVDGEDVTGLAVGTLLDGVAEGERVGIGEIGTIVFGSVVGEDVIGLKEGGIDGEVVGINIGCTDRKIVTGLAVGMVLDGVAEGYRVGVGEIGATVVGSVVGNVVVGLKEGFLDGEVLGMIVG